MVREWHSGVSGSANAHFALKEVNQSSVDPTLSRRSHNSELSDITVL